MLCHESTTKKINIEARLPQSSHKISIVWTRAQWDQFKYVFFQFRVNPKTWATLSNSKSKPNKIVMSLSHKFFCRIISVFLTENIPVKTWQIRQIENMSKNWADRAGCPPQLSGSKPFLFTSHGECVRPVEIGKKVLIGDRATHLLIRIRKSGKVFIHVLWQGKGTQLLRIHI